MAEYHPIQANFNAGEFAPELAGRVDIEKMSNACKRMENFIPLVQGPARRRSGTKFVEATKFNNLQSRLVPMYFADTAFQLEFGENYIRFYKDRARLTTGAVAAYSGATAYTPGDLAESGGVNYYCVAAVTGVAPPNPTYWHALTNDIYEIPTPYTESDLIDSNGLIRIDWEQSEDVLYIFHPDIKPRKLIRFSNDRWVLQELELENGPFIGVDSKETRTVYSSAATGTGITLTASTAIFTANHVGSLFLIEVKNTDAVPQWEPAKSVGASVEQRSDGNVYASLNAATTGTIKPIHLSGSRYDGANVGGVGVQWEYRHSGYGIARITAIGGGGTTATADVISRIPSQAVGVGNPTTRWSFSALSEAEGWPSHGKIFRERLFLFRGTQAWYSVAGAFEDFADRIGADVTVDMSGELPSISSYPVQWVREVGGVLVVGTTEEEVTLSEITSAEPLGPGNIKPRVQTSEGTREVKPVKYNDSLLFALRSGRTLRELRFTFESDGFATTDLSVLGGHILGPGIRQMAFAKEPHSILWATKETGGLIGFTFNREQDVIGFHRHTLAPSKEYPITGRQPAYVESVSTIPSALGGHDELWMVVQRFVDGAFVRYVEYMENDYIESDEGHRYSYIPSQAYFVDCGIVYTPPPGPGTATITGLDHLEGETVAVLNSGTVEPTKVVSGGAITLESIPSGQVAIGLPYTSRLIPMRPEGGSPLGTSQGQTKRIIGVRLRLLSSFGGQIGVEGGTMEDIRYPETYTYAPGGASFYTGDTDIVPWPEGWETDAYMLIEQSDPLPLTVAGIMPEIEVST
jgi:hypothetical protein